MNHALKRYLRSLLAPALSWFRRQLDQLDRRLVSVQERQDELVELNRAVIDAHDAEVEVVGRTLAAQRHALEAVEVKGKRFRPLHDVLVTGCTIHANPLAPV